MISVWLVLLLKETLKGILLHYGITYCTYPSMSQSLQQTLASEHIVKVNCLPSRERQFLTERQNDFALRHTCRSLVATGRSLMTGVMC